MLSPPFFFVTKYKLVVLLCTFAIFFKKISINNKIKKHSLHVLLHSSILVYTN